MSESRRPSVIGRLASGLLASAASLLALALILECALRVFGIGDDAIAGPHPWTGWVHLPGLRAELKSEDPADRRRIRFATNSLGLRDVERSLAKPPGVYRVLLLGDSFVAGAQVPVDSTVSRVSERILAAALGHPVEVWNCGVSGYSTAQQLLFLRHVAKDFGPDLVVLGFFAGNDVADQVAPLASSLRNRPFFHQRGDSLVLDRGQLRADGGLVGWLRRHSRLFGWATTQLRAVRIRMHEQRATRAESGGIPPALMVYAERPDSLWSAAWTLSERLIVEVREEARRQGAEFVLLSIPSGAQVHAEARANRPGWERWGEFPGLSLEAPERRLAVRAAECGIEFVPLLPAFRAEAERSRAPLHIHWSLHWNALGHAVAARTLSARLVPLAGQVRSAVPAGGTGTVAPPVPTTPN
ncbi:MAG: SGNH/GDSL hydrolase family protein [Candidatus Eisenbacteria bacterium]